MRFAWAQGMTDTTLHTLGRDLARTSLLREIETLRARISELESTASASLPREEGGVAASEERFEDVPELRFEDIFNLEAIQEIQDAFAEATNVASVITDLNGRPITKPSRFCRLCIDVVRRTETGLRNCMRSDASFGTNDPLKPIIRPCLSSGLWDGGTSILVGNRHVANWIIGQVRIPPLSDERMRRYAREIGADEDEFLEALCEVPIMPRSQFLGICRALCLIANQISTLAMHNALQARAITRRLEIEAALRESENRFRQLSEATFEGIFIHNAGEIMEVNKVGCMLFGFPRDALLGRSLADFASPDSRAQVDVFFGKGGGEPCEASFVGRDGRELICELQERDISFQGKKVRVVAVRDITERVFSERTAREKQQQLIQADKMVSLGALVAGMAHEINNPNSFLTLNLPMLAEVWEDVTPILEAYYHENGDFLAGGLEYSELRDYIPGLLARMQEGATRIKGIVNSLKNYSRVNPEEIMWRVDLNDVVSNSLGLVRNLIAKSTNVFDMDLDRDLPKVRANPQRVSQVLINLLVNACEALTSRDQGIFLTTRSDAETGAVIVEVRDQGPGIPPDILPKIMDPFFTTKRESGGTGLGLSVSSAIAREHGGSLIFSSVPGEGTEARLVIPQARMDATDAE